MIDGERIRILMAKIGLDGHDRGIKVVARALRDSGIEVIYTGLHQTPENIVEIAVQEDVHAIGVSILSGSHNYQIGRLMEILEERKIDDIKVFVGGIIPDNDTKTLVAKGVVGVFGPGTPLREITEFVINNVGRKQP